MGRAFSSFPRHFSRSFALKAWYALSVPPTKRCENAPQNIGHLPAGVRYKAARNREATKATPGKRYKPPIPAPEPAAAAHPPFRFHLPNAPTTIAVVPVPAQKTPSLPRSKRAFRSVRAVGILLFGLPPQKAGSIPPVPARGIALLPVQNSNPLSAPPTARQSIAATEL